MNRLKEILKRFLSVRVYINRTQSLIGFAEIRVNFDDPCEAINCFFLVSTTKLIPITAVSTIIIIAIIDAS